MSHLQRQFESVDWPAEFVIIFKDGSEQAFVSSEGVSYDGGHDADGGRARLICAWKKKSPSQPRFRMIQVFLDEVAHFRTVEGALIWEPGA